MLALQTLFQSCTHLPRSIALTLIRQHRKHRPMPHRASWRYAKLA